MDQDVVHRLSTPSLKAGRPRYSLVWKLVFVPKSPQQQVCHDLLTVTRVSSAMEDVTGAYAVGCRCEQLYGLNGGPVLSLDLQQTQKWRLSRKGGSGKGLADSFIYRSCVFASFEY